MNKFYSNQLSLNGAWSMKRTDWPEWIEGSVPGSVYHDLLQAGRMDDPFYGENDRAATSLSGYDYEYFKEFTVAAELMACERVYIRFEGLDTLAEISVNEVPVAATDNMHRTYEFDVKHLLREGFNRIHVVFLSPLRYVEEKNKWLRLWGVATTVPGYPHLRKAHHMFGWDWGPQLPDAGIWKDVSLIGCHTAKLEDVHIRQQHQDGKVSLQVVVDVAFIGCDGPAELEVIVRDPNGTEMMRSIHQARQHQVEKLQIHAPELWWPNGYGSQPLYSIEVALRQGNKLLETETRQIGLRTLVLSREKDEWGESFAFEVNGLSVFAMGADYIPEDSLLARCDPARTEKLIQDCVEAHFNCLRVWGGGIYPSDYFYDLCDRYGLIVWQDFMFACAQYDLSEAFTENITMEFIDQIKRLRHHASLGLWCGNNEMEWAWEEWAIPDQKKLRGDYLLQFEKLIPDVLHKYDPDTYYWPCSPSSGGGFVEPNHPDKGDTHFWDVFNGKQPYEEYRKHYFRFLSEFGFQSFPDIKTVYSYTNPEDRNIFSPVMENHNKRIDGENGNVSIMHYIAMYLKYPKDFESIIYASQVVQAEAVRCAVEHCRRNRGRCMGTTYWQLNDCYPVASWASIDYYGRWKALHYHAKRFYAPILVSAEDNGNEIDLYLVNDTTSSRTVSVSWKLVHQQAGVLQAGVLSEIAHPLSSCKIAHFDFSEHLVSDAAKRNTYFSFAFHDGENANGDGTVLFLPLKHFDFMAPEMTTVIREEADRYILELESAAFAKSVSVAFQNLDAVLSDNYFDLCPGERKEIAIGKAKLSQPVTLDELRNDLQVRSVFDIA